MDRSKVKISNPCGEDFDQMHGHGAKRFCGSCRKHVHNLSALTQEEAVELIRQNGRTGICVTYRFDTADRILFRPPPALRRAPRPQLLGIKKLLAAAVLVPVLATLPACETHVEEPAAIERPCDLPSQSEETYRPIDDIIAAEQKFLDELKSLLEGNDVEVIRTAGEPMVFDPEMVMGDIAYEPEPVVEPVPEPVVEPIPDPMVEPVPEPPPIVMGMMAPPDWE